MGFIKKLINKIKIIIKNKRYKKVGTYVDTHHIIGNVEIGKNCLISKNVILNDNIKIGDFTYLNSSKYWITVETNVKIGKFCSIAPGVHIGAGNHEYKYVTTHPILFNKKYVKTLNLEGNSQIVDGLKDRDCYTIIGNDVWIGFNAIIKRGIKIGNGTVIAAGSVVVKDVPDYAIVGGNPARIIKYRTSEENIKIIQEYNDNNWWNWDYEKIRVNFKILYDFDLYVKYITSNENNEK